MDLFRITQGKFAEDLSGNGARLYGGRWNSEGLFALYTSFSRALALLETLAHTPAKMLNEKEYMLITLSIPDTIKLEELDREKLTAGWDAPDTRPLTKNLGDQFLRQKKSLLLAVPSVLMPEENNFLINPVHKDMRKVKLVHKRKIYFDTRVKGGL
ncbi:MAG TPA: RES family NAD+ phosphorylase [Chitinophagaceae bacterium]|nr:RES family NAD+ phosphorylase [Chitinophagaceae bacterium]